MGYSSDTNTNYSSTPLSQSPPPPPSPTAAAPPVIMSPCAACKTLRRRCADKCLLAPYFPPTDPAKFAIAHRVFGASNIIKFLQELSESERGDAVSSMVYEASARIRDPVYGCAGTICRLQKQVNELQAEVAKAQAEVVTMQVQLQHAHLLLQSSDDMNFNKSTPATNFQSNLQFSEDSNHNLNALWEMPLWT